LIAEPKEIIIKRFDVYGNAVNPPSSGCMPYEVASGSGCEYKCTYCATHPSDSQCQPRLGHISVAFEPGFGCQCGEDKCKKELYPRGLCAYDDSFCPGGSYCCLPDCIPSSQIRINGKCYPKCLSCSEITTDCACGTDASTYLPMTKDNYCCPKNSQPYSDKVSCDTACKQAASTAS